MITMLLDVLFPRRCLGCGGGGWPFCEACIAGVAVLGPPGCRRCGRPLEVDVERCTDCPPLTIAGARAAFLYEGPVRRALMRMKFGGVRLAAPTLAAAMVRALEALPVVGPAAWGGPKPPTITWVPLGRRRKRTRGFDQAEALARCVARLTGWPVRRLLGRAIETAPQARRSGAARRDALRGAFRPVARAPLQVLLIDDVLTSGATADECARALLVAGARDVRLLTAARSLGGPVPTRCYNPAGLQPGSVVAREIASR